MTDQALRSQMGQRARQLVEERYAWDEIAECLEDVYRSLIDSINQTATDSVDFLSRNNKLVNG